MGKGTRKQEKRAREAELRREREQSHAAKKSKRLKITALATSVTAGTAAVVLAVCFTVSAVLNAGGGLRKTTVAETEHYSVNGAMASYYMYSLLSNFKSDNSTYLSKLMDVDSSLKNQACYYEESKTWFEYFTELTKQRVTLYLSMAEKAYSEGESELSEANAAAIETEIASLKKEADSASISLDRHLRNTYGRGVKEQDVRDALKLFYISYQYRQKCYDGVEVSASEASVYCDNNKTKFYTASYYTYTVKAEYDSKTATDATVQAAIAEAKRVADEIAKADSVSDFLTAVKARLKAQGKSDDDITEALSAALTSDAAYSDSTEAAQWVFKSNRRVGDTAVFSGTELYTVYCITEPSHRDETLSKNLITLEFSSEKFGSSSAAKRAAEALVKELDGSTDVVLLEKAFSDYSEKNGVSLVTYDNMFEADVSEATAEWLFADTRKLGDTKIMSTGFDVLLTLYSGNGISGWESQATAAIKTSAADKLQDKAEEEFAPSIYSEAFNKIEI